MPKYTFKAEPGIKVTVEIEQEVSRLDALRVGAYVLNLYDRSLTTPIDIFPKQTSTEIVKVKNED